MKKLQRMTSVRILRNVGLATAVTLTVSACNVTSGRPAGEGIGFHETRYEEVAAMRDYRKCRDEGLELDRLARASGDRTKYLASARLLEKCESELGPEAAGVARDERMRAYGLSILNFLRGGDMAAARNNLQRYTQTFAENDLYFADGSSFRETMQALLGQRDDRDFGQFSMLNVNRDLKEEMRRIQYWNHR